MTQNMSESELPSLEESAAKADQVDSKQLVSKRRVMWLKLKNGLNKAVKFALPVIDTALEFKKDPGVLSGLKLALSTKTIYESIYDNSAVDPNPFTKDSRWTNIPSNSVERFLYEALKQSGGIFTQIKNNDSRALMIEYNGFVYGLYKNKESEPWIYYENEIVGSWNNLKDLFWNHVCNQALVNVDENERVTIIPYEQDKVYDTELSRRYTQEIRNFHENGYSRSYLFYGPPGTGKSNLAAKILNELGYRSIIFSSMNALDMTWIRSNIDSFGTDAIVLEDLDHVELDQVNKVLDSLQYLRRKGLLILATCNQVEELSDALIRCGRFDECVEVNSLPEEVIRYYVDDDELYELVKTFPITYLKEVKARLEVLGREETLRRMSDLSSRVNRSQKNDKYRL